MSTVQTASVHDLQELLFGGVDGYGLSSSGRERTANFSENFTYGELTPEVVSQMLRAVEARDGEVFYDLGAGTGKGVLYAGYLSNLAKCVGIELIDELYYSSVASLDRYNREIRPTLSHDKQAQELTFVHGDILTHDYSDADIVFTHCTCFNSDLMQGVVRQWEALKPGARVITVSKGIESPLFEPLGSAGCQMAWGSATLYFYRHL